MPDSTTRHRAMLIGLVVSLPVTLLGGLPAASHLADQYRTMGSAWSEARIHGPQVAPGASVEISGTTETLLRPGHSSRINLGFDNVGSPAVTLRHVRVTITGITAPQATAESPCTRADFRIRPMRAGRLVLPGDGSTDLARLGVPMWQWPHVKMRNRPLNQDGCKGARLELGYVGYRAWSG